MRRLRASRALRAGFAVLAVAFLVSALVSQWGKATAALSALSWWSVALATVAGVLAPGGAMLAWRTLLADLGSPLRPGPAVQVMFLGQLGKYLPGGVWQVVATMELGRDHAAPRKRTFTATVLGMAITLVSALALTAVALPFTSAGAAHRYWWVLALVPVVAATLHPRVLTGALNAALRLARREPLERGVGGGALVRALGWTVLGWALLDVQAWLLVTDVHRGGLADFLPAAAAYMLAWSVGFLTIFAPGGIGTREVAMAAALAPLMDWPQALVIATVSRLISMVADLAWAGLAFGIGRFAPARRGGQAPPSSGNVLAPAALHMDGSTDRGTDGRAER
ncbi:MAG TPA: lysylphosphatidylglycerol synthase transmembrane domain-containing protein [Streptosporangiaceae bacterium]|nr:lysylphosphatidylglycerol synthase transmembrane domain-containing protein [Streptosporangiaceae bacterium]